MYCSQYLVESNLIMIENDTVKFFTSLGYYVSWDFDKETCVRWYDIYDKDRILICRLPWEVPLEAILEDFRCFYFKKLPTSFYNYKIYLGRPNESKSRFNFMLEKIFSGENDGN